MTDKEYKDPELCKQIINSIVRCIKTEEMNHLSRDAYDFLKECEGFKKYPSKLELEARFDFPEPSEQSFVRILYIYRNDNQFSSCPEEDPDYELCAAKRAIYNSVINAVTNRPKFKGQIVPSKKRTIRS